MTKEKFYACAVTLLPSEDPGGASGKNIRVTLS